MGRTWPLVPESKSIASTIASVSAWLGLGVGVGFRLEVGLEALGDGRLVRFGSG